MKSKFYFFITILAIFGSLNSCSKIEDPNNSNHLYKILITNEDGILQKLTKINHVNADSAILRTETELGSTEEFRYFFTKNDILDRVKYNFKAGPRLRLCDTKETFSLEYEEQSVNVIFIEWNTLFLKFENNLNGKAGSETEFNIFSSGDPKITSNLEWTNGDLTKSVNEKHTIVSGFDTNENPLYMLKIPFRLFDIPTNPVLALYNRHNCLYQIIDNDTVFKTIEVKYSTSGLIMHRTTVNNNGEKMYYKYYYE